MKHTLSVIVEDRPGALTRITTMFARRGFNIESLAVGPTERAGVSCITLRVDCTQHSLEQIEKQIHKLVNVLRVTELVSGEAVERELLVIRVSSPPERRAELVTTAAYGIDPDAKEAIAFAILAAQHLAGIARKAVVDAVGEEADRGQRRDREHHRDDEQAQLAGAEVARGLAPGERPGRWREGIVRHGWPRYTSGERGVQAGRMPAGTRGASILA